MIHVVEKNEKLQALGILVREPEVGSVREITSEVAMNKDGFKLFPQPVIGDELDPLNWSFVQKHTILSTVMAL
jgi:hypothetical protein